MPWSSKELKIEYATFRDKLKPGQEEEWQIKISGSRNEKIAAEMVVAMYDASLDEFAKNSWFFNPYPSYSYSNLRWTPAQFSAASASWHRSRYPNIELDIHRSYKQLNWFDFFHLLLPDKKYGIHDEGQQPGGGKGGDVRTSNGWRYDGFCRGHFELFKEDGPPPPPPSEPEEEKETTLMPLRLEGI